MLWAPSDWIEVTLNVMKRLFFPPPSECFSTKCCGSAGILAVTSACEVQGENGLGEKRENPRQLRWSARELALLLAAESLAIYHPAKRVARGQMN